MKKVVPAFSYVTSSPAVAVGKIFESGSAGSPIRRREWRRRKFLGFTLVEMALAVAILGVLAAVALPSYQSYWKKVKIRQAMQDLVSISATLTYYKNGNEAYPSDLAKAGWTKPDPWGNPYQYLDMAGASVGQKRKDRSLHPLNSDFDLYSMGPDGKSVSPLTAKASQDDIIRANDGAFIGVAADY
jgi:general secretion pathway protein G